MVLPRLSICQLWAAPLPMTSSTSGIGRPLFWPKAIASDRPWTMPAMQIWLTIFASWPAPASPTRVTALAKCIATGWMRPKTASSPPHMTVNAPFTAPAWPPETGASMKCRPCRVASAASSRATSAEAVVWSTRTAPGFMPAKAPSAPSTTERRSASLPTQQKTMSAPWAASRGVAADCPPNSATQACAFAGVRL